MTQRSPRTRRSIKKRNRDKERLRLWFREIRLFGNQARHASEAFAQMGAAAARLAELAGTNMIESFKVPRRKKDPFKVRTITPLDHIVINTTIGED